MINVVYFVFLNPNRCWHKIVVNQLLDFKKLNMDCRFFIQVDYWNKIDKMIFESFINNIYPSAFVNYSFGNNFEYNGIKRIYDLAHEFPNDIFLYFHSKGMLFSGNGERTTTEKKIFDKVISEYQHVLNIFDKYDINRVGLCCADSGFMWFNFWWARGSYLINCEDPQIEGYRYYYENWLCRNPNNDTSKCYSLSNMKNNIGSYYSAEEACQTLDHVDDNQ